MSEKVKLPWKRFGEVRPCEANQAVKCFVKQGPKIKERIFYGGYEDQWTIPNRPDERFRTQDTERACACDEYILESDLLATVPR